MEFIELKRKELSYPVGIYISKNIPTIISMAEAIKKRYPDNGESLNLWCKGSSGAIIAAIISSHLSPRLVNINHVKKKGEYAHSECWYSHEPHSINVIVDDFIRTGETILSLLMATKYHVKPDCLCVSGPVYATYEDKSNIHHIHSVNIFDEFDVIISGKIITLSKN